MSITISVRESGVGRPFKLNENDGYSLLVWSGDELPALDTKGNKLPVGEYEVDLVWQCLYDMGWSLCPCNGLREKQAEEMEARGFETRKVYIASVAPESKEKTEPCMECLGNGTIIDTGEVCTCIRCEGNGYVDTQQLKQPEKVVSVEALAEKEYPFTEKHPNALHLPIRIGERKAYMKGYTDALCVNKQPDWEVGFSQSDFEYCKRTGFKGNFCKCSKLEDCGYSITNEDKPEKEVDTIERAAEIYYPISEFHTEAERTAFKTGARWQVNSIKSIHVPYNNGYKDGYDDCKIHIKSTHVPIEEVERLLDEYVWNGKLSPHDLTEIANKLYLINNES